MRKIFGEGPLAREERIEKLQSKYDEILSLAKERGLITKVEDLKSFLPSKKRSTAEILGEWYRLWKSYLPGIFSITTFQ
ncbi:MAG: hypothetical protein BAJALOKI1v1_450008 [Promethearchaeota archaeon]|nr:MAG: hypothetical protein BAJALOKI1v1_450008 [Candidatus Lokiarchaeota archaeon]